MVTVFQVMEYTPWSCHYVPALLFGTHEIQVQAIDNFDVQTSIVPVSIVVEEESNIIPSLDSDTISGSVMVIILIGFTVIAAVAVIFLMRRGGDKLP